MFVYKKNDFIVPVKIWISEEEYYKDQGLVEQIENLARLPFAYHHVALVPDGHVGYGMPIGGIFASIDVVIPNAVGSDISCGVIAIQTDATSITKEEIKKIFGGSKENKGGIRSRIPLGFKHHSKKVEWSGFDLAPQIDVIQSELSSAEKQLGTLGGGNHFIEIQKGDDGFIWAMIHSGSRNFGYKIAKTYNKLAQELCNKWYSNIPFSKGEDGLAFLPIDSEQGREYLTAMNYASDFALENRSRMMNCMKEEMSNVLNCNVVREINVHHNYARLENHFGRNIMVHRKGATSAKLGQYGLIPGSQGTSSYVVVGKGNQESFMSCSHGAGRKMSRKKAREELNLEEEQDKLNKLGIIHSIRNPNDLDEASSAYKDINIVMDSQKDLVDIEVKLSPLAVIKG